MTEGLNLVHHHPPDHMTGMYEGAAGMDTIEGGGREGGVTVESRRSLRLASLSLIASKSKNRRVRERDRDILPRDTLMDSDRTSWPAHRPG